MKVRIEIDRTVTEPEIIIRFKEHSKKLEELEKLILDTTSRQTISFYQGDKEFYLSLEDILFFETENNQVFGHTSENIYQVKLKLYELEKILPNEFLRVSKSTILNIDKIYSIDHSFTSYYLIQFYHSHKQVYASRFYYKDLKKRLKERKSI